jgi:putative FmdB family regulatory protein
MPTYEYACKSCGEHLEIVQSFKDEPLTTCPACGGPLRKVFGSIGIAFKGSGFYKTDSRSSSAASSAAASSGKGDPAKADAAKSERAKSEPAKKGESGSGSSEPAKSGSSKPDSSKSSGPPSTAGAAAS